MFRSFVLSLCSCFLLTTVTTGCAPSRSCGVEGETQSCRCPGGPDGVQTCLASGAWNRCSCAPTPDAAIAPDSARVAPGDAALPPSIDAAIAVDAPTVDPVDAAPPPSVDATSGPDAAAIGGFGRVYVTTRLGGAHTIGAAFERGDGFTSDALCATAVLAEVGSCQLLGCVATPPVDAGPISIPPAASAGTIAFNAEGADVAFLLPMSDASYPLQNYDDLLWSLGTLVHVRAAGADAPAFDIPVFEPSTFTATAPDFGRVFIDVLRTDDLPVAWSGSGSPGDATSTLRLRIVRRSMPIAQYVECRFRPSDASSTIDSAVLTPLPSGNYDIRMEMLWGLATRIDGWNVGVRGVADVMIPAGTKADTGLILR